MRAKPVLIYDRGHFSKYTYNGNGHPNSIWSECIINTATVWISPHLATEPKLSTMNVLYHAALHFKHPKLAERNIRKIADEMIPITPSMSSKKKKFCIAHYK